MLQGLCELHASFGIDNNGVEPVSLWSPEEKLVGQVWLPRMRNATSFGRLVDGEGPAPVPVEETFEFFGFFGPGETSFGLCA